jgi:nicotinamidase-related amidase
MQQPVNAAARCPIHSRIACNLGNGLLPVPKAIPRKLFGIRRLVRLRLFGLDLAAPVPVASREAFLQATIKAEPEAVALDLTRTALLIIDMQRDFLEPGGFGETLGNDVSLLGRAVAPTKAVLDAARAADLLVIHTREGHRPDLSDAPKAKIERGHPSVRIGAPGPMGRILIRGEPGHDIIPALYPIPGEPVIDKPGKGAFYATDLDALLRNFGIQHLLVCGVTTEVCVNTTVREANDRGYRCVVLADCCASYFPEFHQMGLAMIKAQGAIFGWVSDSAAVLAAMKGPALKLVSG